VNTLGRRSENMIALSGDSYASGRHAEIRCDAGGCVLVDVGSTNGTFLRGGGAAEAERLRPHDPQSLAPAMSSGWDRPPSSSRLPRGRGGSAGG